MNSPIQTSSMQISAMIQVQQLTKTVPTSAGPLTILHDLSFSVAAGSSLAIVGSSGSGKSTLLALLAGLDVATSGDVRLEDVALSLLNEDGRARLRGALAGFVFQSFHLLPDLSALENVMLPLELAGRTDSTELATQWLNRVGLGARIKHTPRQLSGGEQQRVALARAFAPGPKILFADEPTGSLDSATGEIIADLLFDLNREAGTTLVLVTHDETLAARCHSRLRLAAGAMVSYDA